MTQTVVWERKTGRNAGILLKCSQKISGGQKLYLEILLPAGAELPETGTPLLILPENRQGIVLDCRVTGSNSFFLRFIAEVRLDGSDLQDRDSCQITPE